MVWDQLPAKIKILMKQNYQDKVVLEGENQSPHTLSTPVCLVGVAPYTYTHLKDITGLVPGVQQSFLQAFLLSPFWTMH